MNAPRNNHDKVVGVRVDLRERLLLLVACLALVSPEFSFAKGEARANARRKEKVRAELTAIVEKQGGVLDAIDAIESSLSIEKAGLKAATTKIRKQKRAIQALEHSIETTALDLEAKRAALRPRLVVRYKLGELGVLPALLSAQSVSELAMRRRLLGKILQADHEQIQMVQELVARQQLERLQLDAQRQSLTQLQAAAARRVKGLKGKREDRQTALALLDEEAKLQRALLLQLAEAERGLQRKVHGLAARSRAVGGFAALRGKLLSPAKGRVEQGFGSKADPRYETVTLHKGIDIRAKRGSPVVAVAGGQVVHAGWLRGYGNLLILDHGNAYFSLMAHLDEIQVQVGTTVTAGQMVATVGDSASLKGAYLYFEIRHGGQAVDPVPWLRRGP